MWAPVLCFPVILRPHSRCPRACGDPSHPLEPHVNPSPSRNLVVVAIPPNLVHYPPVLRSDGSRTALHPPLVRCFRRAVNPSPKHHSERSESVPRNLAAGSHTPLQPTSSRRGLPCGRPSCVFPSFLAPTPVVLAHAGTHPLLLNHVLSPSPSRNLVVVAIPPNLAHYPPVLRRDGSRTALHPPLVRCFRRAVNPSLKMSFQTQRSGAEKSRRWVTHSSPT